MTKEHITEGPLATGADDRRARRVAETELRAANTADQQNGMVRGATPDTYVSWVQKGETMSTWRSTSWPLWSLSCASSFVLTN